MQAIEFQNVRFFYASNEENGRVIKTVVLNDLDFTVEQGSFVALLGRNGSGKSTLARLVNGLLKPTLGKVIVFGMDTSDKKNLFEIRKKAGMVFQNPDNQQIASIVEDDIAFGPENIGMKREEIGAAIDFALKATDMEKYRHTLICQLSKGYKQRVGFAQALMGKPPLVILDEPMVGLDPNQIVEMRELIRSMAGGQTVILSSHILSEIETICDKIIIIDEGRVVAEDTVKKLEEENTENNILRVVVKGKKGDIHKILRETELVKRFQLLGEVEPGVYEFQVVTESGTDVRDELFLLFAHNQMIVYSINTEQLSLEEVFRKVTNKEE